MANDDKLPPEKLAIRKAQRKEQKALRKAVEPKKEVTPSSGEPMETDDSSTTTTTTTTTTTITTTSPPASSSKDVVMDEASKHTPPVDEGAKEQKGKEKETEDDKEKLREKAKEEEEEEIRSKESKDKGKEKKVQKKKLFYKYVSIIHRELKPSPMRKGRKYEPFGYPFVFSVDPEFVTNRQIYDMVFDHIKKIYKKV